MTQDSSVSTREQTPHVSHTTRTATIIDALKRRAQAVLNDKSIDPQSRAIIRHGLETNDPWLAELVRRAEAGENMADTFDLSPETDDANSTRETDAVDSTVETSQVDSESETKNDEPRREKIEALAELICNAGEEAAGALFVLMGTLQNSSDPRALANAVKHFTFTRCGELNIFGMVDAQIAVIEGELMARNSMTS